MSHQDSNQSPVYLAGDDDPEMKRAIDGARQTFRCFWREMAWERRRIVPALDLACVKIAFSDPPGKAKADHPPVEQMWVNDVDFDGKQVTGTLINSPNWLTSVKEGDHVRIHPTRISDWMYAIQGKVYGAYTVNLMRSRMGKKERAQHDSAWGLDFGNPDQIRLVPPDYLGKKKSGFFNRWFGGAEKAGQDPGEVVAKEHPMALNMAESLDEFLKKDPARITAADERGFTLLHQLALAGATTGVAMLLRHGADPSAQTRNGMTALSLAKSLGWKEVERTLEAHKAR